VLMHKKQGLDCSRVLEQGLNSSCYCSIEKRSQFLYCKWH